MDEIRLSQTGIVRVRPANLDDAENSFIWRNQPATRNASRNTKPLPWHGHSVWWDVALHDPTRHLFIVTYEGRDVGVVWFAENKPGIAEISIYLSTHVHGRGIGPRAIALAAAQLPFHIHTIEAGVKPANAASLRCFQRIGFVETPKKGDS